MRSQTKLTYQDYLQIPEDGLRHEIVDGEHVVNSAPLLRHQFVSGQLYIELHRVVQAPGLGRVYYSPVDVELSAHDILQPDLVAIFKGNYSVMVPSRVIGAPDLVVEVLSPSTRHLDRVRKRQRYEAAKVPQYWIVDPERSTLENWLLRDGALQRVSTETQSVSLSAGGFERVSLTTVWWVEPED